MAKKNGLEPEHTGGRSTNEISMKLRTLMSYPSVAEASFDNRANVYKIKMYNGDEYHSADTEAFYKAGSFVRTVMPWQKGDYPRIADTPTQRKIREITDAMQDLLLYKNNKYGDSAINPKKIFYKGDSTNSILIRLDDKLGRVMSNTEEKPRVNDVADIIGYCVLLLISMGVRAEDIAKFKD